MPGRVSFPVLWTWCTLWTLMEWARIPWHTGSAAVRRRRQKRTTERRQNATGPVLRAAKITPTMISTLPYVSNNIQHTTPLNYRSRVTEGALNALRKKAGAMIVTGDPAVTITEPTDILKAAAMATISDSSDLAVEKINEETLREIALDYGGANNTAGGGLAVKFCIVDELPAISDTGTAAGNYCMAYGKPLAYQFDLFGPYEVKVSEDYKFGEGLLAVRGTAMIGGNVVTENAFIRIKNKAGA